MKRLPKTGTVAAVAAGGVVVGAVALAAAEARWKRETGRVIERVERLASAGENARTAAPTFSRDELLGLPAPVVRYFELALTPGQPLYRHARLQWEGRFRLAPNAQWKRFVAGQHMTAHPPGFVWDATIDMLPLVPVRVRDVYAAGEGAMLGKIAALIPVVDERGTREMAAGALSRHLGEAVWLPTALLPSAGVSWTPIDDDTARATLVDGTTAVSADFSFGSNGEITAISMNRYRDVDGRGVLTRFEARLEAGYRRVAGMMVPIEGEAAWMLPEGRFTFWRGRLVDGQYRSERQAMLGRHRGPRRAASSTTTPSIFHR